MKINARLYNQATTEPFMVQDLDNGVKCELHYLNENPFFQSNALKGNFAIWSSTDGINYRLFVEKGYYEIMKDLHDIATNNIWMGFYGKIEKIRKLYSLITLPVAAVLLAIGLILNAFFPDLGQVLILVIFAVVIVMSFVSQKLMLNKMKKEQFESINHIKRIKGAKSFEKTLEEQAKYTEKFFEKIRSDAEKPKEEIAEKSMEEKKEE